MEILKDPHFWEIAMLLFLTIVQAIRLARRVS